MKRILILALSIIAISVSAYGLTNAELQLEPIAIKGVKTQIKITVYSSATEELEWALGTENEEITTGKTKPASTSVVGWTPKKLGKNIITLASGGEVEKKVIRVLPGILTILPPLLAILLALATRQVLVSLLTSIWLGAFFIYDFNPLSALWRTADKYLLESLADRDGWVYRCNFKERGHARCSKTPQTISHHLSPDPIDDMVFGAFHFLRRLRQHHNRGQHYETYLR
jgi:hypothetical protein